jgi:hypothetical protein
MHEESLFRLQTGLRVLTEELKSIDICKESDKYKFCGILEYCAVFEEMMADKEDPDVVSCQPAYLEFMKELSRCCETQIENIQKVESLLKLTRPKKK